MAINSKAFKNDYVINIISKICNLFFAVGASAFITRFMGDTIKGDYAFITSVAAIVQIVCNLGVYQGYPNQVKSGMKDAKQKFVDIFFLQMLAYITIAGVVYVCVKLFAGSDAAFLALMIMVVSLFSMMSSQVIMICMVEHPLFRSLAQIATSFVNLGICAIVFFTFKTPNVIIPVIVLLIKDTLMVALILIKERVFPKPWKTDFKLFLRMIKFGFLPMITSLVLNLNYKMDVFMLKWLTTSAIVGVYSVGVYFADQIWLIPDSFKEVLFSRAVRKDSRRSFNISIKVSVFVTSFVCIIVALLGRLGIYILYGTDFMDAYYSMLILLIGIPFMSIFKVVSPLFIAEGKTGRYFLNLVFGVIINVTLNYFLIPLLGGCGAAIATVASQVVCGIVAIILYRMDNKEKISELLIPNKDELRILKSVFRKNGKKEDSETK